MFTIYLQINRFRFFRRHNARFGKSPLRSQFEPADHGMTSLPIDSDISGFS